jgi:hypothetical protein
MAALINRNLDAVRRENVDLAKRVAALKLKLGITAQRDAAERERVMRSTPRDAPRRVKERVARV